MAFVAGTTAAETGIECYPKCAVGNPFFSGKLGSSSTGPGQLSVPESASCSRLILSGEPMCEQCEKLQKQIDQYYRILNYGFDPLTEERLKTAVSELEKRKAELH